MKLTEHDINAWLMEHEWAELIIYVGVISLIAAIAYVLQLVAFCIKLHMIKEILFLGTCNCRCFSYALI